MKLAGPSFSLTETTLPMLGFAISIFARIFSWISSGEI
jgi:hypothetical protein